MAMDDYDIEELPNEEIVYNLVATCGQGELPANCKHFAKELASNEDINLSNVKYAMFGLGDKSYVHFNEAAKVIDDAYKKRGAKEVISMGLGDDKDDEKYETAWYEWFPNLAQEMKFPDPPDTLPEPKYKLNLI
eukprot:TRINITY_DN65769_c0_g1_i1.p1 TRINITY_DN65769_c0_g1~~TRINITY_DN65769_c0_g1_i1.p1  ORF type:complete len:134 (+),score=5.49 TRINITY_DN65769_c0_g1_i1:369-770(+)